MPLRASGPEMPWRGALLHQGQAPKDQQALDRREDELEDERTKLLQLHYADALPVELTKDEQQRITMALESTDRDLVDSQTQLDIVEANLNKALDHAANWAKGYKKVGPTIRRQFNRGFKAMMAGIDR